MNKTIIMLATAVLAMATTTACSSSDDGTKAGTLEYGNGTPVEKIVLNSAEQTMVANGNQAGLKMLKAEEKAMAGKSFVMSPLSAGYLLGMLHEGTQGQTQQEIAQALGFSGNDAKTVSAYFKKMLTTAPAVDNDVKLTIANAIYGNTATEVAFTETFVQAMKDSYLTEPQSLDFSQPTALQAINSWCSQQTNGLIKELMAADEFNADASAYLLNAMYFKALWSRPFDKSKTRKEAFTMEDGQQKDVNMMYRQASTGFWADDDMKAASLPYGKGDYMMTIVLPNEGSGLQTADVIARLADGTWQQIVARTQSNQTTMGIAIPRFRTEAKTDLKALLMELGIHKIFTDEGDFAPMLKKSDNVSVSKMFQKAVVEVDEDGTQAASASASEMAVSADLSDNMFKANRPFVFVIHEKSTNAIFFMGQFTGK